MSSETVSILPHHINVSMDADVSTAMAAKLEDTEEVTEYRGVMEYRRLTEYRRVREYRGVKEYKVGVNYWIEIHLSSKSNFSGRGMVHH